LYEIIFEIQLAGYKPVLAHPERYLFYSHDFKEYDKLKKVGCYFQLNLLSTVDYYGKNITKIADKLLSNEYYDFVGSDIHHQNHVNSFDNKVSLKNIEKLNKAIEKNLFFLE
jgi:tyrosine-protein phosphatase YwqE